MFTKYNKVYSQRKLRVLYYIHTVKAKSIRTRTFVIKKVLFVENKQIKYLFKYLMKIEH